MKISSLLVGCCLAAAANMASAYELFDSDNSAELVPFKQLPADASLGGYPLLPIGDTQLLGLFKGSWGSPPNIIPSGRAYLIVVANNTLVATVDMAANLGTNSSYGNWTNEPCKRNDYLWKQSLGGDFSNVNCASINHIVRFFDAPTGPFQQYLVWLRAKHIQIPPTVLQTEFTRYASKGRWLSYKVAVNPEYFGLPRDTETIWGASVWYKDFVNRDPRRAAFVANLSQWAQNVQSHMNAAFGKQADAFSDVPPLLQFLQHESISSKN